MLTWIGVTLAYGTIIASILRLAYWLYKRDKGERQRFFSVSWLALVVAASAAVSLWFASTIE